MNPFNARIFSKKYKISVSNHSMLFIFSSIITLNKSLTNKNTFWIKFYLVKCKSSFTFHLLYTFYSAVDFCKNNFSKLDSIIIFYYFHFVCICLFCVVTIFPYLLSLLLRFIIVHLISKLYLYFLLILFSRLFVFILCSAWYCLF